MRRPQEEEFAASDALHAEKESSGDRRHRSYGELLAWLPEALGDGFGAGVILHTGVEAVRLAPKIWALPLPVLWAARD